MIKCCHLCCFVVSFDAEFVDAENGDITKTQQNKQIKPLTKTCAPQGRPGHRLRAPWPTWILFSWSRADLVCAPWPTCTLFSCSRADPDTVYDSHGLMIRDWSYDHCGKSYDSHGLMIRMVFYDHYGKSYASHGLMIAWSYEHMFASSHAKFEMRIQLGSQVFCCVTVLACHINLCLTMRDALTPRQPTHPPPPRLLPRVL